MNKQLINISILSLLSTSGLYAEEQASSWKAAAELGFVSTSGNTETETLNAKAAASKEQGKWRHKGEITALHSSDAISTTAEKYTLGAQSNYKFSEFNSMYGSLDYEDDRFSGYQYRVTESIGYARRVYNEKNFILDLEIGPGARQSKLDNGETDSEGIIRAGLSMDWKISPTSRLTEKLTVEAGEDVTISKSVTALSSKVNGSLSMKVSYTIKNTSEVPVGLDETDTETAITLVYDF